MADTFSDFLDYASELVPKMPDWKAGLEAVQASVNSNVEYYSQSEHRWEAIAAGVRFLIPFVLPGLVYKVTQSVMNKQASTCAMTVAYAAVPLAHTYIYDQGLVEDSEIAVGKLITDQANYIVDKAAKAVAKYQKKPARYNQPTTLAKVLSPLELPVHGLTLAANTYACWLQSKQGAEVLAPVGKYLDEQYEDPNFSLLSTVGSFFNLVPMLDHAVSMTIQLVKSIKTDIAEHALPVVNRVISGSITLPQLPDMPDIDEALARTEVVTKEYLAYYTDAEHRCEAIAAPAETITGPFITNLVPSLVHKMSELVLNNKHTHTLTTVAAHLAPWLVPLGLTYQADEGLIESTVAHSVEYATNAAEHRVDTVTEAVNQSIQKHSNDQKAYDKQVVKTAELYDTLIKENFIHVIAKNDKTKSYTVTLPSPLGGIVPLGLTYQTDEGLIESTVAHSVEYATNAAEHRVDTVTEAVNQSIQKHSNDRKAYDKQVVKTAELYDTPIKENFIHVIAKNDKTKSYTVTLPSPLGGIYQADKATIEELKYIVNDATKKQTQMENKAEQAAKGSAPSLYGSTMVKMKPLVHKINSVAHLYFSYIESKQAAALFAMGGEYLDKQYKSDPNFSILSALDNFTKFSRAISGTKNLVSSAMRDVYGHAIVPAKELSISLLSSLVSAGHNAFSTPHAYFSILRALDNFTKFSRAISGTKNLVSSAMRDVYGHAIVPAKKLSISLLSSLVSAGHNALSTAHAYFARGTVDSDKKAEL